MLGLVFKFYVLLLAVPTIFAAFGCLLVAVFGRQPYHLDTWAQGLEARNPAKAGFRQSGSSYLPPGQTSEEAGVHQAGFCAPRGSLYPFPQADKSPYVCPVTGSSVS